MAKTGNQNLLEKHLEKAILALSALFLVYAALHWGLSTPIDPREAIAPDAPASLEGIDPWLLKKAQDAESHVNNGGAKLAQPPQYSKDLAQLMAASNAPFQLAAAGSPRLPTTMPGGRERERIALADLVSVIPAPEAPKVNARRVLLNTEKASDVNAAFGIAAYPFRELGNRWADKLKNAGVNPNITFQMLAVERRELGANGQWMGPTQVKLEPLPLVDQNNKVPVPVVPSIEGNNIEQVRLSLDSLRKLQEYVVQPPYGQAFDAARQCWVDWRAYLPQTDMAQGEVSAEVSGPIVPSGTAAEGPQPVRPPVVRPPVGDPDRRFDPARPPMMVDPMRGGPMGEMPGGPGPGPMPGPGPGPMPGPAPVVRPVVPAQPDPVVTKMQDIPALAAQLATGKALLWFMDPTMETGKVYQYRVKLVMVNPLLGCENDVKDSKDAKTAAIETPASEWSEAVCVKGMAEFFVTGKNSAKNELKVTLFAPVNGRWAKHSANVTVGQSIGGKFKTSVFNPVRLAMDELNVDFDTGAVVMGVNFDRTMIRPGSVTKETAELTYLGPDGQICCRLLDVDQGSDRLSQLEKMSQAPRPPQAK